jgi:hypothetical protein
MTLLVNLCALLDDPGELEPEVCDIQWRLFLVRANNAPDTPISKLVEALWGIVGICAESRRRSQHRQYHFKPRGPALGGR